MLLLLSLLACGPTERCYDACYTLYGKGEDVCGGPDAVVTSEEYGFTFEERECREVCRLSVEAGDRNLDEEREEWAECVSGYERDVAEDARKYGEPDEDACMDAYYECGGYPCSTVTDADGTRCVTEPVGER